MRDRQIDWSDPRRRYPEYPDGSVVEVRVHGIGGEPPSRMTRDHHPVLVTGDETVGVFRARDPVVGVLDPDPHDDAVADDPASEKEPRLHVREVVSWGGQTSGTWRHALWVLLLPFALFNVAGRMHVEGPRGAAHRALCRVLGLTMTLTFVGVGCTLAIDLIAMQCGSVAACLDGGSGSLLVAPFRAYRDDPVGRLALAALLPSATLILSWIASRYRLGALGQDVDQQIPTDDRWRTSEPIRLADPSFWDNAWATSRMRGLHVTAGTAWITGTLGLALLQLTGLESAWLTAVLWVEVAVVGACLVMVALPATQASSASPTLAIVMDGLRFIALVPLGWMVGAGLASRVQVLNAAVAGIALIIGLVCFARWAVRQRAVAGPGGNVQPDVSVGPNLLLVAGSVVMGAVVGMHVPVEEVVLGAASPPWPGWVVAAADLLVGRVFVAPYVPLWLLSVVQVLGMVALAAVSWTRSVHVRRTASQLDDGVAMPGHVGAVVLTMISLFVTAAVGAGLHGFVADLLGVRVIGNADLPAQGGSGEPALVVATWLSWTAKVLLVLLVVSVVLALWSLLRTEPVPDEAVVRAHLAHMPPPDDDEQPPQEERQRLRDIGSMWLHQRRLRLLGGHLLVAVSVATLVLLSMVGSELDLPGIGDLTGLELPATVGALPWHGFTWLDSVSLIVVSLVPAGAFLLVRQSLSDRGMRKQVGRLWDVVTFWPRVSHPLAPPCYSESLVPMLRTRIDKLVTGGIPTTPQIPPRRGGPVILAGHSQGSVIALATAAQLDPSGRDRVALAMWGSPVAILYERWFRAAFGPPDSADAPPATATGGHSRADRADAADAVDAVGDGLFGHVDARVRHWHHVFSLTEPFAMPFWRVHDAGRTPLPLDEAQRIASGWGLSLDVASGRVDLDTGEPVDPCVVCQPAPGQPHARHVDLVILDPDVWTLPDGSLVEPGGHGVYRGNLDVDLHMRLVARDLVDRRAT